jgi:hypothetical protein
VALTFHAIAAIERKEKRTILANTKPDRLAEKLERKGTYWLGASS